MLASLEDYEVFFSRATQRVHHLLKKKCRSGKQRHKVAKQKERLHANNPPTRHKGRNEGTTPEEPRLKPTTQLLSHPLEDPQRRRDRPIEDHVISMAPDGPEDQGNHRQDVFPFTLRGGKGGPPSTQVHVRARTPITMAHQGEHL